MILRFYQKEYEKFYCTSPRISGHWFSAKPEQKLKGSVISSFMQDYTGEKIQFVSNRGSRLTDFISFNGRGYLVTEKVKNLFESNKITGCRMVEVNLKDKNGVDIEGYYLLTITSFVDDIDYRKSVYVEDNNQLPRNFYVGRYFPLKSWDGSHIFKVKNKPIMFLTEELVRLINSSKLKLGPFRYEKVTEVKSSTGTVEKIIEERY